MNTRQTINMRLERLEELGRIARIDVSVPFAADALFEVHFENLRRELFAWLKEQGQVIVHCDNADAWLTQRFQSKPRSNVVFCSTSKEVAWNHRKTSWWFTNKQTAMVFKLTFA